MNSTTNEIAIGSDDLESATEIGTARNGRPRIRNLGPYPTPPTQSHQTLVDRIRDEGVGRTRLTEWSLHSANWVPRTLLV